MLIYLYYNTLKHKKVVGVNNHLIIKNIHYAFIKTKLIVTYSSHSLPMTLLTDVFVPFLILSTSMKYNYPISVWRKQIQLLGRRYMEGSPAHQKIYT